jgi:AcrR family transcriptional regulator
MGDCPPILLEETPVPRYKDSDRQEIMGQTRQRLLQAATTEFAREGYARANINRISRAAGYAKGTVYNYFASKRALMMDLIDEIAGVHFDYIATHIAREDAPTRRLERFFEAGFAWVTDNLDRARVMFTTLNGPDREFKVHMYEVYQPMFQLVGRDIVALGVERESFRQVDPATAANLLMTIYLGVGSQVNEQGKHWFTPGQVTDLLLDGLRKQSQAHSGGQE